MGINDEDISRHMAGEMPKDDPAWGEVSAFLESLDSAYPVESLAAFESRHVAALAREARLVQGEQQRGKRSTMKDLFTFKTHRALVATVAAALLVLTAGVGVASALGVNPLSHLVPALAADPTVTPDPTLTPEPTGEPSAEPTDDEEADDDRTESPKATPTKTHESQEADDEGEDADDEGEDADDQGDDSEDSSKADDDDSDHDEDADADADSDHGDYQGEAHGDYNGGDDERGQD